MSIRIVIADDHPVILAGVREALDAEPDLQIVAAVSDSTSLVQVLSAAEVDVVVTDYSMPGGDYGDGVALIGFLRRRFPRLPLVVLTGVGGTQILAGIRKAGATSIIAKVDPVQQLAAAIRLARRGERADSAEVQRQLQKIAVSADGAALSRREAEVLRLIAEGLSQKEIAAQLKRSRQTISTQKHSAMRKLGLERSADIFEYAVDNGIVSASQAMRARRGEAPDGDDAA
ncbi:response regulator [Stenotrophomonas beteli]|uniref:LuxR family transcriptional regulator n=1 Tax=Stenotrophomonas beteli TaxID=3384461 RepID=A0A0R0BDN8_9GAMM|nr:response regulator [Stenotrophomonas maltophilia]KRG52530.1 LuxR family transcriptional regulator [Stenotrophomonas maltophilia]